MIRAFLHKEWVKSRMAVAGIAVVLAALTVYTFIDTGQTFRNSGAVEAWNAVITKDMPLLPSAMRWFGVLAGVVLAIAQFAPEMTGKRLKLTLHLPVSETKAVAAMVGFGASILLVAFGLAIAISTAGLSVFYPAEMIRGMVAQSAPWFMAGLFGYFAAAWVCLEPTWRQRIFNAIAGVCLCSLFFTRAGAGAMTPMLPLLGVITAVSFTFPFHSVKRFKDGAQ